mmetsp:Transcript_1155/g.3337  ORF Transcript_1155/g.3337 Transcript_1155/m.3337 type:complete len:201 (-) Transcript_1155:601-1203(-)
MVGGAGHDAEGVLCDVGEELREEAAAVPRVEESVREEDVGDAVREVVAAVEPRQCRRVGRDAVQLKTDAVLLRPIEVVGADLGVRRELVQVFRAALVAPGPETGAVPRNAAGSFFEGGQTVAFDAEEDLGEVGCLRDQRILVRCGHGVADERLARIRGVAVGGGRIIQLRQRLEGVHEERGVRRRVAAKCLDTTRAEEVY